MALNCYSGKATNDNNRELRITVLGFDKSNNGTINIYSTIVPIRDTLPSMPREYMSGKAKTKNNITVSNGDFMTYTLGSIVINEKKVTLTVADDLIFDLGDIIGSPTRSVLKSMLTGEIFKESYSDTDGVKPLGINGNAVYVGSAVPQMSFGNDWKWLFKKESEVLVAGGEGVTKNNAFLDVASVTQLGIVVEVKTTYGDGSIGVIRYAGACGGNIQDVSGTDLNRFTIDLEFNCDAKEYDGYFIDGGYKKDDDSLTSVFKYKTTNIINSTYPYTPPLIGVEGDTCLVLNPSNGNATLYKYTSSVWNAYTTPKFKQGTIIFSQNCGDVIQTTLTGTITNTATSTTVTGSGTKFTTELTSGSFILIGTELKKVQTITTDTSLTVTTTITTPHSTGISLYKHSVNSQGYKYVALKSGGEGVGVAVGTTIITQAIPTFTLGTTYMFGIKDFDFTTQSFLNYTGNN